MKTIPTSTCPVSRHTYSFTLIRRRGRGFPGLKEGKLGELSHAPHCTCFRKALCCPPPGNTWQYCAPATQPSTITLMDPFLVVFLISHPLMDGDRQVGLFAQSCPTLATPWTVACQPPLSMDSPGKKTGVGCHFLLQGIFQTRGSNLGLLHCKQTLYWLPPGKLKKPFSRCFIKP